MVFLAFSVALPLGLLKNIESLSNVSALSIGFYSVFIAEVFNLFSLLTFAMKNSSV